MTQARARNATRGPFRELEAVYEAQLALPFQTRLAEAGLGTPRSAGVYLTP